MASFDLDTFDNPPPRYLYKYLSAERVENVLEGGTVRFTPLMDTNDTFEVRSTFNRFAGPKMLATLAQQIDNIFSGDSLRMLIADTLKANRLDWLPPDLALKIAEQHYGGNFVGLLRSQTRQAVDRVLAPHLNDQESANKLLEKLGRDLLCFSLSERMDSPPMWAHYADNNAGFVVAFDTEHLWFRHPKNGNKTRLQKVAYFDGKLDEPFENPQVAFISKITDWAYEREWRIYIKNGEADLIIESADAPIQLVKFPPEAVNRVILGARTRPEVATRIRKAVTNRYPNATITRVAPNRKSHTYDEIPE